MGSSAAGAVTLLDNNDDAAPAIHHDRRDELDAPTSGDLSAGEIYKRSQSAVVEIQAGNATGTGFVIDEQGHVVTSEHVAGDSRTVQIRFADESEEQGRVIETDPSTDIALIEVDVTGHVTPVRSARRPAPRSATPSTRSGILRARANAHRRDR